MAEIAKRLYRYDFNAQASRVITPVRGSCAETIADTKGNEQERSNQKYKVLVKFQRYHGK